LNFPLSFLSFQQNVQKKEKKTSFNLLLKNWIWSNKKTCDLIRINIKHCRQFCFEIDKHFPNHKNQITESFYRHRIRILKNW